MLNDVLEVGLKLVVCGTAAGAESASCGVYYASPANRFWSVLSEVGLTPPRLEPSEFRELLHFGIGLTDVTKDQAGPDASIDIQARFSRTPCQDPEISPASPGVQWEEGCSAFPQAAPGGLRPAAHACGGNAAVCRAFVKWSCEQILGCWRLA